MTLFEEIPDRLHRIATFLAVLEMVRLQMIVAFQRRLLDEIWIASREPGFLGEGGEGEREALAPHREDGGAAPERAREGEA